MSATTKLLVGSSALLLALPVGALGGDSNATGVNGNQSDNNDIPDKNGTRVPEPDNLC